MPNIFELFRGRSVFYAGIITKKESNHPIFDVSPTNQLPFSRWPYPHSPRDEGMVCPTCAEAHDGDPVILEGER